MDQEEDKEMEEVDKEEEGKEREKERESRQRGKVNGRDAHFCHTTGLKVAIERNRN